MTTEISEQFLPVDLCEDLVCCVICFEPFTEERKPKALPCLHTYCAECLGGTISAHKKVTSRSKSKLSGEFPCPVCKEIIKIPENGLDGFKDDFRVKRISEVLARSREEKERSTISTMENASIADFTEDDSTPESDKKCDFCRFYNKDSDAIQYCLECMKTMCAECSEKHLKAKITHDHTLVSSAYKLPSETTCPEHPTEILRYFCRDCREPLCTTCTMSSLHHDHTVVKLGEETDKMKLENTKMAKTCREIIPDLEKMMLEYDNLERKLQSKEKGVMKAILARTMDDILQIRAKQQKMETELEQICRDKYQGLKVSRQCIQEKMATMMEVCELVEKVTNHGQDVQLMTVCTDLVPELKSLAAFAGSSDAHAPEEDQFVDLGKYEGLVSSDLDSSRGKEEWKTSILSEIRSVVSQMRLISTGPAEPGRVQLVKRIGRKGSAQGEFHFPSGAACFRDGSVAIADMHNHRVQIFNNDGSFRNSFGGGKFKPCGIAVTKDGNIAVTDCGTDELGIKIFTPDGEQKCVIGEGVFEYPFSVAVDSRGRFVVCDPATNKITILLPNGSVYRRFPTKTRYAFYININHRDDILVSDWFNNCIRIFDSKGQLIRKIGSKGTEDGQLMIPLGLCTDRLGNVIVLDCKCGRVSMFGPDGKFLRHIVGQNEGIEFSRAITMTREGLLVITSGDNRREIPNEVRFYQL